MNIKYFRSGDNHIYAVFDQLVHTTPGRRDHHYYEGLVSTPSGMPESLIIHNSMLEQCVQISESQARMMDQSFYFHLSMFLADKKFATVILARDVTVGMVVHENGIGPLWYQVIEVVPSEGKFMIATAEMDLAEFKPWEPVERIVNTDLVV